MKYQVDYFENLTTGLENFFYFSIKIFITYALSDN